MSLAGPLAMMVLCQLIRALLDDRTKVYELHVRSGGVTYLPPWTMSIGPKHPLRTTLLIGLCFPVFGLLMHLFVAVIGLIENKFSFALSRSAGVSQETPVVTTLFYVGMAASTLISMAAAFRLARIRKGFELPSLADAADSTPPVSE